MNDLSFSCQHCGQHVVIDDSARGCEVKCPTCGGDIMVPSISPLTPSSVTPTNSLPHATGSQRQNSDGDCWKSGDLLIVKFDVPVERDFCLVCGAVPARSVTKAFVQKTIRWWIVVVLAVIGLMIIPLLTGYIALLPISPIGILIAELTAEKRRRQIVMSLCARCEQQGNSLASVLGRIVLVLFLAGFALIGLAIMLKEGPLQLVIGWTGLLVLVAFFVTAIIWARLNSKVTFAGVRGDFVQYRLQGNREWLKSLPDWKV